MRAALSAILMLAWASTTASAQTSPSPPAASPPASPGARPPAGTVTPTPSQQNLDAAPPGRNLQPGGQGTAVAPAPPSTTPPPGGTTDQSQNPPPAGGSRPQPGGANSSAKSREAGTGKNPANESLTSCLAMWERTTHMTKQEWARACRRVDDRLRNMVVK
jgi:hypothetical protein